MMSVRSHVDDSLFGLSVHSLIMGLYVYRYACTTKQPISPKGIECYNVILSSFWMALKFARYLSAKNAPLIHCSRSDACLKRI